MMVNDRTSTGNDGILTGINGILAVNDRTLTGNACGYSISLVPVIVLGQYQ